MCFWGNRSAIGQSIDDLGPITRDMYWSAMAKIASFQPPGGAFWDLHLNANTETTGTQYETLIIHIWMVRVLGN
jgi:hypothetical protein